MSFVTVNEYISSLEENAQKEITDFAAFMEEKFPMMKPRISFSMPMWWAGAKMYDGYVAVSAAKKHYSVHFLEEAYIDRLKVALPGCSFGKRCINIKYGDEASITLVKQYIIEYLKGLE